MGVTTWPMIEFEADDALAAAAHLSANDKRVDKVCIWTVDKDLGQCVVGDRVVQIDRRKNEIRDEQGVIAKFGVAPEFIPDYLALVGDSADGFPGLPGYGPKTAATLINRHGHLEEFPVEALKVENVELALLFKRLATLRIDAALPKQSPPLFRDVEELRWRGPTKAFAAVTEQMNEPRLLEIVKKLGNDK
jgi:5'-3' exonuclease